jgi:hypothetical protein
MPDYSDKQKFPNIGDTLANQGSRIGTFDQVTYNKYYSSFDGESLDDGYCKGAVTDWLRRILLTTNASKLDDPRFVTYSYEAIQRGDKEVGKKTLEGAQVRAQETVLRMVRAYGENPPWTYQSGASGPMYLETTDWEASAKKLDNKNERKKRFSQLQLLTSKYHVYDKPGLWMGAILGGQTSAGPISAGCGALLGFQKPGYHGHSVGVWRRRLNTDQPDSYYFFDPNYGMFAFSSKGLNAALTILFWYGDGIIPKNKDCCSPTATGMRYVVFGPENIVGAVLVQNQPLVAQVVQTNKPTPPQTVQTASKSVQTMPQQTLATASKPTVQSITSSAQPQSQPQGPSAGGYTLANTGLSSPGNISSIKPPQVTTQPANKGQGKHAELIAKLEKLKTEGKHLDMWDGAKTAHVGGVLQLTQPQLKDIKAALQIKNPWGKNNSPIREKGVLSAIAVNDLTDLIDAVKS